MGETPAEGGSATRHLAFVDGLRAVAALAVLWTHGIGCAYTVCIGTHQAWRFLGGRGVDLFFVISGFCLAYPFLARRASVGEPRIDYLRFMLRRITRIVPPYYVVLLLLGLLALTPVGFPGNPSIAPVPPTLALNTFARDLAFSTSGLQVFNSVFWTLGVEMRWYFVAPFLIALFMRAPLAFWLIVPLAYALHAFPPFGLPSLLDLGTLPCFMLGIVAADLSLRRIPWLRFVWAAIPIALIVLFAYHGSNIDYTDPAWHAISFAIVVAGCSLPLRRVLEWKPLVVTGVASYSIYLVHLPVVWYLERAGVRDWPATALALGAGFAFWWLVERPLTAPTVRRRMEDALRGGIARLRPLFPVREAPELAGGK